MSNTDLERVSIHFPAEETGGLPHSKNVYIAMFPALCGCRIAMPRNQRASDLLARWLADHPGHIRRDHLNAKDFCEWLDSIYVSDGGNNE